MSWTSGRATTQASVTARSRPSSGRRPAPAYDEVDPTRQLPLDVPVRCIHGTVDDIVPISQSREYVDAAVAAGADATLTEVDGGDHFVLIDPASAAWTTTLGLLDDLV